MKAVQVLPLYKGGDLNYYPKLSCLSVILQSLVSSQLHAFLEENNVLQPQ